MKILIDASSINKKNVLGSIPNYILRLIDGFLAYSSLNVELLVDYNFKDFFEQRYPLASIHFLKRNFFLYRIPFFGPIYGRNCYKKSIKSISYDVELVASDLDPCTKIEPKRPRILVMHDIKGVKDPNCIQRKMNLLFYKSLISTAKAIVAISDYTKNDLIQHLNTDHKKITVIPNSLQLSNQEKSPSLKIPAKYILYVNTLQPHKNPITLIKAFENIRDKVNYELIIVGKQTPYWKNILLPYIKAHNLSNRILLFQNLSSEELQYLYNKASLFVSTSKREGFGYTPIEAAMSGIPVICSTSEALPYSTQGLLYYYEPVEDYNALSTMILGVLNKPPSKQKLNDIANRFKDDYSPKRQVETFCNLIQRIEIE